MNVCSVNKTSFEARIQFDNKVANTKRNLPQKTRQTCCGIYVVAKRVFVIPMFFPTILSRIIKVRRSIKVPS